MQQMSRSIVAALSEKRTRRGSMDEDLARFEINPELDLASLRAAYHVSRRVRVRHFLTARCAEVMYQHLYRRLQWRTFIAAGSTVLGTTRGEVVPGTVTEEKEILKHAYDGAHDHFAYVHDADRIFPEDAEDAGESSEREPDALMSAFDEFINAEAFLQFVRGLTGLEKIQRAASQATRFRVGQFVGFHSATQAADKTNKRRASFFLNLTPEWKPERGGLVGFRTLDADVVDAYVPCFNALDVVAFPQGYWIGEIAPFAKNAVYGVAGRLYVR